MHARAVRSFRLPTELVPDAQHQPREAGVSGAGMERAKMGPFVSECLLRECAVRGSWDGNDFAKIFDVLLDTL